jgi:hypothetical protein
VGFKPYKFRKKRKKVVVYVFVELAAREFDSEPTANVKVVLAEHLSLLLTLASIVFPWL